MKFPIEIIEPILRDQGSNVAYEAIVRDCAHFIANAEGLGIGHTTGFRLSDAILARYGLKPEDSHEQ